MAAKVSVAEELWDRWRPVILDEMRRQKLNPCKLQELQPVLSYRTVYGCLRTGGSRRAGRPNVPEIGTIDLILLALGRSWSWLDRKGRHVK